MIRALGSIPIMTPLQIATESSVVPKSDMKTIVGGDAELRSGKRRIEANTKHWSARCRTNDDMASLPSSNDFKESLPARVGNEIHNDMGDMP